MSTPISPGELSSVHTDLEGTHNCTKCHILGKKVSDENCLDCHKEIKSRIENQSGYHSSREVKQKKCINCHSDHHGKNFEIIHFDTLEFDHNLTAYELEGKHGEINCSQCHTSDHVSDQELKKRPNTFLGLTTECLTCHDDYHQNTLAVNCAKCHSFNKFKPAPGFNHTDAAYQLLGKHQDLKCELCHKKSIRNNSEFQQFKGLAFDNCNQCHKDIHAGKLGTDCKSCHIETSFRDVKNLENFNHSLTAYPLEGKHASVKCYDCHRNSCTEPLAHSKCNNCHEDYHHRVFSERRNESDCIDCHDISGFNVPKYTIEQHNASAFALNGAHLATPCLSCHKKTDKWLFRNIGSNCVDCHKNIHEGYMNEKYIPDQSCKSCHVTINWESISFDHSKTGFILEGRHKEKDCKACHIKTGKGVQTQIFSQLDAKCITCHNDIHFGQFIEDGLVDCNRCHKFNNWEAVSFNHENTKFKLDGKHVDVACNKCHPKIQENNAEYIKYKIAKYRCEDCH